MNFLRRETEKKEMGTIKDYLAKKGKVIPVSSTSVNSESSITVGSGEVVVGKGLLSTDAYEMENGDLVIVISKIDARFDQNGTPKEMNLNASPLSAVRRTQREYSPITQTNTLVESGLNSDKPDQTNKDWKKTLKDVATLGPAGTLLKENITKSAPDWTGKPFLLGDKTKTGIEESTTTVENVKQPSKLNTFFSNVGKLFVPPTGEFYELDEPIIAANKALEQSSLTSDEIAQGKKILATIEESKSNDKFDMKKILQIVALALPLFALTQSGSEEIHKPTPPSMTSFITNADSGTPNTSHVSEGNAENGNIGDPSQRGDIQSGSSINGGTEPKPVEEKPVPGVIEYPRAETPESSHTVKEGENFRDLATNVIKEQEESLGLSAIGEQERANIISQMASVMTLFQYAKTGNDPDILQVGDKIEFPNNQTLRDILDAVTNAEINPMDYNLINTTERIDTLNTNLQDPTVRRQQLLAVYKLMSQLGEGAEVEQLKQFEYFINKFSVPVLVDSTNNFTKGFNFGPSAQ